MNNNPLLLSDSYKYTHHKQYPPGTEVIHSYLEARDGAAWPETVFFGLQYYLERYLAGEVVTKEKIDHAEQVINRHIAPGTFNRAGWEYILRNYGGKLPVEIRAVPEGTVVPNRNVLMTIENNDTQLAWLTNFLETLLVQVWYPCTVATLSREAKKIIAKYLELTGDLGGLPFKLHNFGFRGSTSVESAGIGGAAHLVNFLGTDTVAALETALEYYGGLDMPGFSIPASEHSTITSWGREREADAFRNMLEQYPKGLMACVSDSYNIMSACDTWGTELKEAVLSRDGVLVVRPDSGDPATIVPEVIERLGYHFGFTTNEKGYRVLHPKVRVIQGDGCNLVSIEAILAAMERQRLSADNIAFGMGGGLLQKIDRDTQRFAMKCSATRRDGQWHDVYKQPVGDRGKSSKRGRLKLIEVGGNLLTVTQDVPGEDLLQTVFNNGEVVKKHTFPEVRARATL